MQYSSGQLLGMILEYFENITTLQVAIAAVFFLIGLFFWGVIWGGQRRQIRELEDELELCRVRAGHQGVNVYREPEMSVRSDVEAIITPEKSEQNVASSQVRMDKPDEPSDVELGDDVSLAKNGEASDWLKIRASQIEEKSKASNALGINRKEVIEELSIEIEEMRKILDGSPIDVDVLKEYLDVTDSSVNIANDRLDQVLEAFHKRAKIRAQRGDYDAE